MILVDNSVKREDLLAALHTAVAEDLHRRITDGEASAAELSVAVKFLKDNHIDSVPTDDNAIGALLDGMPNFEDDTDG
jgi:hypothetical protein